MNIEERDTQDSHPPTPLATPALQGGGWSDGERLDRLIEQLSRSDQRLMRELTHKLLQAHDQRDAAPSPGYPPYDVAELVSYLDAWTTSLLVRGKSPGTAQTFRNYVEMLLQDRAQLGQDDLELFIAARLHRVGPGALANSIYAAKSFFRYLTQKGVIAANPAEHLQAPPTPLRERVIPTANRVARLLKAPTVTTRDQAAILLFASSGLRAGELITLRRSDLDLERLDVTVVGKGNKQRSVPITEQTERTLEKHIRTLPLSSPWLFPGRDPSQHLYQTALNQRFETLSRRAGIPTITPHHLRHYFASFWLNKGVSLKIVSQWLGHSSPSVTANVYWHLLDEAERRKAYQQHDPMEQINMEVARMAVGQMSFDFDALGKGEEEAKEC